MEKYPSAPNSTIDGINPSKQPFLTPSQMAMIDEALKALGDYGELRLVVEKGRLRFLVTQKSIDTLKWTPGSLSGDTGSV